MNTSTAFYFYRTTLLLGYSLRESVVSPSVRGIRVGCFFVSLQAISGQELPEQSAQDSCWPLYLLRDKPNFSQ